MKWTVLAFALGFTFQLYASSECPGQEPTWVDTDKTEVQGARPITFFSASIKQDVSALLYLPPDYDSNPSRRYPVIYWLHGMCGHAWNGATFLHELDQSVRSHQMPPAIVVLVNGMSDSYYFDSADGKWPVERVIVKDLIPFVDKTYRTIGSRGARAIEGFSMGGYGAAHLAFKYPDVFGIAVIDAGAFNSLETFRKGIPKISAKMFGSDDYFQSNDPPNLLQANADAIRGRMRIRLAVGDQDRLEEAMQDLHERLKNLNIAHEYEVVPGVGHDRQGFYTLLQDRPYSRFFKAAFEAK